jgi:hypothetical protein
VLQGKQGRYNLIKRPLSITMLALSLAPGRMHVNSSHVLFHFIPSASLCLTEYKI